MKIFKSSFFSNVSYSILANLFSFLTSMIVVLIVPKLIGVSQYGYWQLYLFYISYVGLFNIGWTEGIYLRYGGIEYDELNKPLLFNQFKLFCLYDILACITMFTIVISLFPKNFEFIIYNFFIVCVLLTIPRTFILFILQGSLRIKAYSFLTIADRLIYLVILLFFLVIGKREFLFLVLADLIARLITLLSSIFFVRDWFNEKKPITMADFIEIKSNITVGIKLLFANLSAMLVIGIVRFGIQFGWNIETFGKVSLSLSISNLMLVFIDAISIVLFPTLKKIDKKNLSKLYFDIDSYLMLFLISCLLLYYPMVNILQLWLPQYSESLRFMALLFPMFVFQCKSSLLIMTNLKALRKEKVNLIINLFTVVVSFILTIFNVLFLHNLEIIVFSITFLIGLRTTISEIYLRKYFNLSISFNLILSILIMISFSYVFWNFNNLNSYFFIIFLVIIYWWYNRKLLQKLKTTIKNDLEKRNDY